MVSCKWFPTAYFIWQIALLTLHSACRFTYGDTMALSLYSAARECATECVCVCVYECVCVCVCVWSVAHLCLALCDLMDHSPPGSSLASPVLAGEFFTTPPLGKAMLLNASLPILLSSLLWMNVCVISEFWLQLSSEGLSHV